MPRRPPSPTLFPYTTLFRSQRLIEKLQRIEALFAGAATPGEREAAAQARDRIRSRLREQQQTDPPRSEEHTSELQSLTNLVCRLLLEKKKKKKQTHQTSLKT